MGGVIVVWKLRCGVDVVVVWDVPDANVTLWVLLVLLDQSFL